MDKKVKIACICVGAVVGVVVVGYGAGVYYYRNRFLPHTSINDKNVAGMDASRAEECIAVPEGEAMIIKERNGQQESISMDDIHYTVSVDSSVIEKTLSSQNKFAWPAHLFRKSKYTVDLDTSYDEQKAEEEVSKLKALKEDSMVAPSDATIVLNAQGVYEIQPETEGTKIIEGSVEKAVKKALDSDELSVDLEEEGCYEEAAVKSDDENLKTTVDILHALNNEVITLDLEDGVTEEVTPEKLASLFTLGADGTATLNKDALTQYVYDLADKYDTQYTTRNFTTTYGSEIQVGGGSEDTYGYQMNLDGTIDLLADVFNSGQTQTTKLLWVQTGVTRGVGLQNDFGNTYIEISLAAQHLWFYQNGSLCLESDIITGLPEHGQNTPSGAFRIWNKERNATLKGTAWDGTKWDSPVAYWMPITWHGVGLHDATWQSAFGGNLYLTRGSHGCVNLPLDVAASIFNTAEVNTPVIIY